jgi:hypothetical protein
MFCSVRVQTYGITHIKIMYNYRYGQQRQTTTNIQTNQQNNNQPQDQQNHDYQLALALSDSFTPPRTPQIETLTIQLNQYTHLSIPSTPPGSQRNPFKYYCPACLHYWCIDGIYSTSCCNNYICISCMKQRLPFLTLSLPSTLLSHTW